MSRIRAVPDVSRLGLYWWRSLLLVLALALTGPASAQQAKTFSNEQLDQMLAPIALYPDSLLSQVLMASTYPSDVALAAQWSKANAKQQGDAAVKAVESQPWDPSVQSLVAFPQVIQAMGEHPAEVQKIGDAFLAQPKDVMDSVQRLRAAAAKAGNLKSNDQQKVVTEAAPAGSSQPNVIVIEPANPQVVYVPSYNPTVVYGSWMYPSYPPYYWPPPPGYGFATGVMTGIGFGVGIAITNSLWGGCNWGSGDVNINVNRYNNINTNNRINANQSNWQHNPQNRHGTPYRDNATRDKYSKAAPGAADRQDARGRTEARNPPDSRSAERARAEATLKDRGADPAQGREQLRKDPATQERARSATQQADRGSPAGSDRAGNAASNNAFAGARDAGATRQQADRGNASRESMNRPAPAARPTGGGASRPSGGGRAGGGGGGGGRRR